eukprot:TRINITY_DN6071_c0_g1_i1.p1 TRINITY_DN6071_c0_g1~~TRINITY_DN6071_c0_g1_i1.p1  ORF type:complete len:294 (-),score=35.84 TRINITY_DN6071_c0_g1_i1:253-1134(-)
MWRPRATKNISDAYQQLGRARRVRPRHRGLKSEAVQPGAAESRSISIFQSYGRLLETNPIATKALTSAAIAGMGDIGCQIYTNRGLAAAAAGAGEAGSDAGAAEGAATWGSTAQQRHLDWTRCARFMLLSGALFAPAAHFWYGFLGRWLPGQTLMVATKRMALDQFVFSPVFVGVFFSALMVLEGEAARIPDKLRQDYWTTLVSNWTLWMPAQLVNFRLVPLQYQVGAANCVGLFWNAYLSFQSFKKIKSAPQSKPEPVPHAHNITYASSPPAANGAYSKHSAVEVRVARRKS